MSSRSGYRALSDEADIENQGAPASAAAAAGDTASSSTTTTTDPQAIIIPPSNPPTTTTTTPTPPSYTSPPPPSSSTQPPPPPPVFPIRILTTTGQTHLIDGDALTQTIGVIKEKVAAVSSIPPQQQRLIFAGKMLQDTQTLAACGIQPDVVIHLFARPLPPAPGQPGSIGVGGLGSVGSYNVGGDGVVGPGTHLNPYGIPSAFGDPELLRSTQSVKLFSSCLVAICCMQLLLLMLKLMATWGVDDDGMTPTPTPTNGTADDDKGSSDSGPANVEDSSAMFFLQVLLNTLGLYVGLIGVRSTNTLQVQSAKIYFYGLLAVGTLWMSLRVIWACNSVALGYDADLGPQPLPQPSGGDNNGTAGGDDDDGGQENYQMDRGELTYMVSLSLIIYSLVWGVCFLRASQFYSLLRRANGLAP